MLYTDKSVELVKEFEGFETVAYPDPGTGGAPYTIGFGRARGVHPGQRTTKEEAERWLREDMQWASEKVVAALEIDLPQSVIDALTSFVYNVGPGAFEGSTLVGRLNDGQDLKTVLEQELPRWNKGGRGPLPGLTRRRKAELELALSGIGELIDAQPEPPLISLPNAAEYFVGLPHQVEAFEYLEDLLTIEELDHFATLYRQKSPVIAHDAAEPLPVPYYYQADSETPHGFRMCFSSTCGMLVEYKLPGTLTGANGDDDYLERVLTYGDTTDSGAQVKALRSYGINASFRTDGTFAAIEKMLEAGNPVAVGWLHRGLVSSPQGGGHWSLVVGATDSHLVIHDPFGEADLVGGSYVDSSMTAGRFVRYSKRNFGPRWMVEGEGTGWFIQID